MITSTNVGNATTTNSGSIGFGLVTSTTAGNATTTNFGTVGNDIVTQTGVTGNATTTNAGQVGGFVESIATNGNATTANFGQVGTFLGTATTTGNATTTNSGSVATFINTVTTAGNATTTNSGSVGAFIDTVTTAGNATTANSGSVGAFIDTITTTGNATTTNAGTVTNAITTVTTTGDATTTNSGFVGSGVTTVTTNGTAAINNSGTIHGLAVVVSSNGSAILTNSGTIANFGSTAIQLSGNTDTLNLLGGSTIIGGINLSGSNDTVNFLGGNHDLTFNTLTGATVTGAIPFVVSGNRVVAVDPTPFAMSDRVLMDFTRNVSEAIPDIETSGAATTPLAGAGGALGFAGFGDNASLVAHDFAAIPGWSAYGADMPLKSPTAVYNDGTALWARGFLGERVQQQDGALLHTDNRFVGGMIGGGWQARPDWRIGFFLGGGATRSTVDFNYGDTKSTLVFAGAFARYTWGASFLKLMVQGGHSRSDSTRNINNNLLPGGIETARASFDGWYIDPEVTYGHHFALGSLAGASYTLTPSVTVRYLHAAFDGYTESGATANLTVGSRSADDFEERGELKLARTVAFAPTEALTTTLFGGVLGNQRVGGTTVDATLLGQAIPFAVPGKDDVWGGFGGLGLEWRTGRVALFGSAEYLALSDSSSVIAGRGGVRITF